MEGTSLEFQEEACREYARAHHITVDKIFVEQGESAKFADRTQLLELVDFCRTHKGAVQVLIVWKVDRFARNVSDHFSVKATLLKYGVRIVSVTEPIDQNPEGKLMETILAGFAQFDNDIRALRTVQGMHKKIEEGIFPWKAPLGYRSAASGGKKIQPDVPDEPLFSLLKKAWGEFATGAYTKAEILRLMGTWGVTTRKGAPLTPQKLDQFFRNPYYAGTIVDPWSGADYEGKHVAMITRADFSRVQGIIQRRNHASPHVRHREEFPLRGSVRCPACQRHMTAAFSRGRSRRYSYYNCANRACTARKSYPASPIHEEFESFLAAIAPKLEALEKLDKHILQEIETRMEASKATTTRRTTQLNRLKNQLHELIRMRAEQLISSEELLEQKASLRGQMETLEIDSVSPQGSYRCLRENIAEIRAPLVALLDTWRTLPPELQARFEQLVLPVGFPVGRIRTAEIGRLFTLLGDFESGKSNGVPLTLASSNQIFEEIPAFPDLFRSMQTLKFGTEAMVRSSSAKVTPADDFESDNLAA
jgi:site-specific DNA recombinase